MIILDRHRLRLTGREGRWKDREIAKLRDCEIARGKTGKMKDFDFYDVFGFIAGCMVLVSFGIVILLVLLFALKELV